MKSLLLVLSAFVALSIVGPDEARAQSGNPLMPNLGVPYTNMQQARAMLARGGSRRNRGRHYSTNNRRPANTNNRPVIINNYYNGARPAAPF